MMKRNFIGLLSLSAFLFACGTEKTNESIYFQSPEIGSNALAGEPLVLKLNLGSSAVDSVVYYLDSTRIEKRTDSASVQVPTTGLRMGNRLITAKVYRKGVEESITSNVILKPAVAPVNIGYVVVNTFPHDTSSYTQGLEFQDGIFYESDGENGGSSLRKVEVSGKVLQKVDLSNEIFAEGLTLMGNKLIQLTWQNKFGMIWDKNSLKQLGQFPYQSSMEGWGLTNDSKRLYKSDGSNMLYFLNKDTFREEGYLEVYSNEGPVDQLNELEYIDGKIYSNIYLSDKIMIIDPQTGAVTGTIDLSALYPQADRNSSADVLNGIAYDKNRGRLFVTGKKWDKLFEIKLKN
ncbi:MAG TPA: glutaminyl-peptide cyclotransferase [Sphingobacteriaceae bacterium]